MTDAKSGRGRPPSWLLDPRSPGAAQQDVVRVESRARLEIPTRLVGGAPWLSARGSGLMVFRDAGQVVLYPWQPRGDAVMARRAELLKRGDELEALDALVAVEDTYRRYSLDAECRLVLHAATLSHLDDRRIATFIFLLRYDDRLELWSMARRRKFRLANHSILDDLP